jgi:uridylate kinase
MTAADHSETPYRRVLLKLSGEALMGQQSFGIQHDVVSRIATEVREASRSTWDRCVSVGDLLKCDDQPGLTLLIGKNRSQANK